jgi:hypothetical protein
LEQPSVPGAAKRRYFFFAALNFAQRARAAAAILFLPAAEIVRVAFTPVAWPFAFAHLFLCAMLIRLRADADRVRPGLE